MTYEDDGLDNEAFEEIISKLPSTEAEKLRQNRKMMLDLSRKAAMAAIQAKNFSHGVGKNALRAFPSSN